MALNNAQYNEIMHEYETKQLKSRAEADKRRDYVYAHVPGFKELDQMIPSISVDFEIGRLSGDNQSMDVLRQKLAAVTMRKKSLL